MFVKTILIFFLRLFLLATSLGLGAVSCKNQLPTVSESSTTAIDEKAAERGQAIRNLLADSIKSSLVERANAPDVYRQLLADNPKALDLIVNAPDLNVLLQESDLSDLLNFSDFAKRNLNFMRSDAKFNFVKRAATSAFLLMSREQRIKNLKSIPDPVFLAFYDASRVYIQNASLKNSPALRLLSDKGIKVSTLPEKIQPLYRTLSTQYFDALPLTMKAGIIEEVLRLPPQAPAKRQLSAALNRSGPVLQKIFQLVGSRSESPEVLEVMDDLKQNIKPFDTSQIEQLFKVQTGQEISEVFSEFNTQPMAAASVGQVHKAKLKDGRVVAVKFLRPGINERAAQEMAVLRKLVGTDKSSLDVLNEIERVLLDELDFSSEAKFLEIGKGYIDPKRGLNVVKRIALTGDSKTVLIMDLAPGQSIAKSSLSDTIKKTALVNLLTAWIDRAWFGDGFFHADLHAGNIFIEPATNPAKYNLTMIDFGSASSLSKSDQKILTKIAIALQAKNKALIQEALAPPEGVSNNQKAAFDRRLSEILSSNDPMGKKLALVFTEAENFSFKTPPSLIMFVRGLTFLQDQVDAFDPNPVDNAASLADATIAKVAKFRISKNLISSMFSLDTNTRELASSVGGHLFTQVKTAVKESAETCVSTVLRALRVR